MTSSRPTQEKLLELTSRFEKTHVVVAGDVVLDEFQYGEISRVSREAPVLILEHRRTDFAPGGAANTAMNLATLGIVVRIVGRVGDDDRGKSLRELLVRSDVGVEDLLTDRSYETPAKTRILAGSAHTAKQQIVRIDRGRRDDSLMTELRARMIGAARRGRQRGDALLLADYGYGMVDASWIDDLGEGSGPLTLDSRFSLTAFRSVDAATPNLEEVERAIGRRIDDDDLEALAEAGRELRRRLNAPALLITRGSRGMTLCEHRKTAVHIPVFGSDEVADVTGAGDTVIAVFTAARAAGGSWREAAELANIAGGIVVMKRGTATIAAEELSAAINERW